MFGSIFSHGFHAAHFLISFTCGNSACDGAATASERATRKVDGCSATMMRNKTRITGMAIRMIFSIGFLRLGLWVVSVRFRTCMRTMNPAGTVAQTFGLPYRRLPVCRRRAVCRRQAACTPGRLDVGDIYHVSRGKG